MEARNFRQQRLLETRQTLVLAAARAVLGRRGLGGVSMREIAKEAGYTPGALYAHFRNKQDVLAGLLRDALSRAQQAVLAAQPAAALPEQALLLQGDTWLNFWLQHPRDLELLLQFFSVRGLLALAPDVGADMHAQVRQTLQPLAQVLATLGLAPAAVATEVEAMLAQAVGLLLVQPAAGALPAHAPGAMFEHYLRRLWAELHPVRTEPAAEASAQVDLFG